MIFQSLEFTGKKPFKHALIHGLIRAEDGRKMSKSLGNGIDPMDVIDKYGADALRWFLSTGSTAGQDVRFSYDKMDAAWNFINKIWNASRFVIMNLGHNTKPVVPAADKWDLTDKWMLSRLNDTVKHVTEMFDKFDFGEAGRALYNFIWNDFCDWYIEMSKATLTGDDEAAKKQKKMILAYVLDQTLRLMHPIMPFVTEKIWLTMPHNGKTIMHAKYPEYHAELDNEAAMGQMDILIDLIKSLRKIRLEANAPMSKAVDIMIKPQNDDVKAVVLNNKEYIDRFMHPKELKVAADLKAPALAMTAVTNSAELYVPLAELINIDDEIARQNDEMKKLNQEITRLDKKLSNKNFVDKAPEKVVAEQKEKLADYQSRQAKVEQRIQQLKDNK